MFLSVGSPTELRARFSGICVHILEFGECPSLIQTQFIRPQQTCFAKCMCCEHQKPWLTALDISTTCVGVKLCLRGDAVFVLFFTFECIARTRKWCISELSRPNPHSSSFCVIKYGRSKGERCTPKYRGYVHV